MSPKNSHARRSDLLLQGDRCLPLHAGTRVCKLAAGANRIRTLTPPATVNSVVAPSCSVACQREPLKRAPRFSSFSSARRAIRSSRSLIIIRFGELRVGGLRFAWLFSRFVARQFCEHGPAITAIGYGVLVRHYDGAIRADIDAPAGEGLQRPDPERHLQAHPGDSPLEQTGFEPLVPDSAGSHFGADLHARHGATRGRAAVFY